MKTQRALAHLIALFLVGSGCAPEKIPGPERVLRIPENTWGMEFKFTPVSLASAQEQSWAKAVALIRTADGSTGTGFFISEDGLFLTNEHVLPRRTCTLNRCPGRQLIRHFTPGGEFEVFTDFQVLAQNVELDFTLIQVKLPPGKKVPFLPLLKVKDSRLTTLENLDLVIIGHPHAASLQVSEAKFESMNGNTLRLKSVALPGNSGSPLIDRTTGLVVGLYHAAGYDSSSILRKSGAVRHYGAALAIASIRDLLSILFPETRDQELLTAAMFLPLSGKIALPHVLPQTDSETSSDSEATSEWFLFQMLGTASEKSALTRAIHFLRDSANYTAKTASFIDDLITYSYARGRTFELSKEAMSQLSANSFSTEVGPNSWTRLAVLQGSITRNECLLALKSLLGSFMEAFVVPYYCQSGANADGRDILDGIAEEFRAHDGALQDQQPLLNSTLQSIQNLVEVGALPPAKRPLALSLLEKVARNADNTRPSFNAEGLFTLLQHDPALVAPGAFAESFRRVELQRDARAHKKVPARSSKLH